MKEKGSFIKGSDSVKIHPAIYMPRERVIYKHRVSAFAGNALQMILRAQGIEAAVYAREKTGAELLLAGGLAAVPVAAALRHGAGGRQAMGRDLGPVDSAWRDHTRVGYRCRASGYGRAS